MSCPKVARRNDGASLAAPRRRISAKEFCPGANSDSTWSKGTVAAMECFNKIIALKPSHAEAHFRRGAALERLEKLEEALGSYDRAIALDPHLTNAYLSKGSVLNRLTRYDDALRCYEAVLRVGQPAQA